MKLENIDLSKLQLNHLPKFDKCPCELCDDGCFDRLHNKHYPECRRKQIQKTNLSLNLRCPLSHYQATFQPATNVSGGPADHRRQPCPPPPDNEIPIAFKNARMSGLSSQRDDYQSPPISSIQKPSEKSVKPTDNSLLKPLVPMQTQSHYQVEYVEKPVVPISFRPLKDSNVTMTKPKAAISSKTTTRSHYKSWQSTPSQPFAEMPAVAGYVLFPGSNRDFSTSTGSTFVPFPKQSQTKPVVRIESTGHLRLSGSMDLHTNYQDSFVSHGPLSARSAPIKRKDLSNQEQVYTRRPMNEISQTSLDFRPYPDHRPPLPIDTEPFLSQIKIGNSSTSAVTKSQYRSDYQGIDTKRHPRQPAAAPKDHQKPYVPPIQKMDTLSVTQRDFQPLDVNALPRIRMVPMKPTLSINDQTGPMENVTMSRFHYKPYEPVKARQQYGEPIPEIYVPPRTKFQGSTTTGETYRGQPGPRAEAYVPEIRSTNRMGENDHQTIYRVDYHPHGLTLCAAKAYVIAENKQRSTTPISAQ